MMGKVREVVSIYPARGKILKTKFVTVREIPMYIVLKGRIKYTNYRKFEKKQ